MPPFPEKSRIAMVLFRGLTQLDLTGPFEIFARMPGEAIDLVSKTMEPVHTDRGLILTPTETFADRPDPDILFVPDGQGQHEAMEEAAHAGDLRPAGAQASAGTQVAQDGEAWVEE